MSRIFLSINFILIIAKGTPSYYPFRNLIVEVRRLSIHMIEKTKKNKETNLIIHRLKSWKIITREKSSMLKNIKISLKYSSWQAMDTLGKKMTYICLLKFVLINTEEVWTKICKIHELENYNILRMMDGLPRKIQCNQKVKKFLEYIQDRKYLEEIYSYLYQNFDFIQ